MTEHQARIISKNTNLLIELEEIKNRLERIYYETIKIVDGKPFLSIVDPEDYLDDIIKIKSISENIEASVNICIVFGDK